MEDIIVSAPGKLILHGEHAVVYGKTALAASLNLRTFLRLCTRKDDNSVNVYLPDVSIERHWFVDDLCGQLKFPLCDINNPKPATEEQVNTLKEFAGIAQDTTDTKQLALIAFLYLYGSICAKDGSLSPISVQLSSRLPTGAGLGSSAAYSTCLCAALLLHMKRISKPNSSVGNGTKTWDHNSLQLINSWAFLAEKIIHGNPSGVDNSVSTYGGALEFVKGKVTQLSKVPMLQILLLNTHVPRSTKTLVAGVRTKYEKYPAIINPVLDCIEAITQQCLTLFKEITQNPSPDQQTVLNDLIDMNQHQLCVLGVGHPSLDKVITLCRSHGLHAKLTGAGGGGCAFALIPPGAPIVAELLPEVIQKGYECWQTLIGGSGVLQHEGLYQDTTDSLPKSFKDMIQENYEN